MGDTIKRILTNREKEIFDLLIQNKSTKEIASKLDISEKTVRNHISNVIQKLDVKGRSQAILELIKMKEITNSYYQMPVIILKMKNFINKIKL